MGDAVSFVGVGVALVGDAISFVGVGVALVGDAVSFVGGWMSMLTVSMPKLCCSCSEHCCPFARLFGVSSSFGRGGARLFGGLPEPGSDLPIDARSLERL